MAVPVKDGDDVTGVLGASVYLEGITEALKDELPGTVFYAVDKEGKFALNSDTGLISQEVMINDGNTSFGRAVEYMLFTGEGSVEYESQGKNWNAEFRKSPLTGWIYAVAESA
ncbi:cache domain-containing protein [Methanolacinia petrolearia]|uniref:cache domain-containing protein n=1 Tax=Methanolacinia petrolearia TaxID=54120 RepID=UPI003BAC151D